jgi:hypothetical protein
VKDAADSIFPEFYMSNADVEHYYNSGVLCDFYMNSGHHQKPNVYVHCFRDGDSIGFLMLSLTSEAPIINEAYNSGYYVKEIREAAQQGVKKNLKKLIEAWNNYAL